MQCSDQRRRRDLYTNDFPPRARCRPEEPTRGTARVSAAPATGTGTGTGTTIVALHRVKHLTEQLPSGRNKSILLTTFTKNLITDLKLRLASLIEPELLARVEIAHIDQLAARVLEENTAPGRGKQRVADHVALAEMRQLLAELDDRRWEAEFLLNEWEQVILGQSAPPAPSTSRLATTAAVAP